MTWQTLPLRRLVDPRRPITYGIVQAGPDVPNGVPYIRPVDMTATAGVVSVNDLRRTSPEIASMYRRSTVKSGDLIISIGPSYGKVMIVPPELRGANLTQGTARIAPARDIHASYLYWALQSHMAVDYWNAFVGGATFRALNLEPLSQTPCPIPPVDEQRRIAEFLDAEISRIDQAQRLRGLQRRIRPEREQALLDQALAAVGDPLVPLRYLCRLQTGVTVDSGRAKLGSATYPYLSVANVMEDQLKLSEVKTIALPPAEARRFALRPGDVLMTEGGDLDKLGRGTLWRGEIEHCLHQNHVFALRPDANLLGEFLTLITRTSLARNYFESTGTRTTNLASTNASKILAFRVPLPSVDEQGRRVREARADLDAFSRLADLQNHQAMLLAERRQALITAAVTGQLDVTTGGRATAVLGLTRSEGRQLWRFRTSRR